MVVLVNDANILIDLIKLGLLKEFTKLSYSFCTTNLVLHELYEYQKEEVRQLKIIETIEPNTAEMISIASIKSNYSQVTIQDCSVWYYAKIKSNSILLTGDARLRKNAENDGVNVRGILFVFDELVKSNVITKQEAVTKLGKLREMNNRLPLKEVTARIESWNK